MHAAIPLAILTCFCVVMLIAAPDDLAISCIGMNELGCILIDGVVVVIGCETTTVCTEPVSINRFLV